MIYENHQGHAPPPVSTGNAGVRPVGDAKGHERGMGTSEYFDSAAMVTI